jgi:hypothetical protein
MATATLIARLSWATKLIFRETKSCSRREKHVVVGWLGGWEPAP